MTVEAKNELRRMAYLNAMGIDAYVSRVQLPGAADTARLLLVEKIPAPQIEAEIAVSSLADTVPPASKPIPTEQLSPVVQASAVGDPAQKFSLAIIIIGRVLWLEELSQALLSREQVQLVQAMSSALQRIDPSDAGSAKVAGAVDISQFDWPIHTNAQLDLSEAAARASVSGFIQRKVEQHQCHRVIVLGPNSLRRLSVDTVAVEHTLTSVSTAQMLHDPALKKQVWSELQASIGGQ